MRHTAFGMSAHANGWRWSRAVDFWRGAVVGSIGRKWRPGVGCREVDSRGGAMESGQTSIHQDQVGATVVRYVAGPRTAVWITRDELLLRWRGLEVWLIAAGVTAVITAYRAINHLIRQTGSPGRYLTWTSLFAAVATTAAIYAGVLACLAAFSFREGRHGSRRVWQYANPGAVLQLRFLADGFELMTATEFVAYPYAMIQRIRVREHTVALSGGIGLRVLPRELFPPEAIAFVERSIAAHPQA